MRQLTLVEAAEALGLRPDSLRRQANRGMLRAYKIGNGRDWIVDYDEVQRYGRENRRKTGRNPGLGDSTDAI